MDLSLQGSQPPSQLDLYSSIAQLHKNRSRRSQVNLRVWIYLRSWYTFILLCDIYISSCYYKYNFDLFDYIRIDFILFSYGLNYIVISLF